MSEKKILLAEDAPVEYRTDIKGWIAGGHFWGDGPHGERAARYHACTHTRCTACNEPVDKGWTKCQGCREKDAIAKYATLERKPWTDEMLYSEARDRFFDDEDDLLDYLANEEIADVDDLRLVLCRPIMASKRYLDSEYFDDMLPDDDGGETHVPHELQAAIDAFNDALAKIEAPLSWSPDKFAPTRESLPSLDEIVR